jgi:hypothetical protein
MVFSKKKISIIVLIICFVALAGGVALKYNAPKSSPELSFQSALEGLRQHSITTVESGVDIRTLSANIVDQLFKRDFKEDVGVLEKVTDWAERKYASFIRPEMITSLEKQIVRFISVGAFEKGEKEAILSNLKQEILGNNGYFAPIENFKTKGMEATAYLPIIRNDLDGIKEKLNANEQLKLKLLFAKYDNEWFLVGVPNLNLILEKMASIRLAKINLANMEIQAELRKSLKVLGFKKSAGITKWGVGNAVIIQGSFENIANKDIQSFDAVVAIKDNKNNSTIKKVFISDGDILSAGGVTEKSWPMIINPLSDDDKRVYDIGDDEVSFNILFSKIVFVDGHKIEMLKLKEY